MSQEKLQTMVMQKFFFFFFFLGGGRVIEVYYGIVQVVNLIKRFIIFLR